jgi:hypothetical protein
MPVSPRRTGAVALMMLAATATVALAAETESFHGRTEGKFFSKGEYRQARISFKETGNRLHQIRFEIRVRCPNGQHRSVVGHVLEVNKDSDGRFRFDGGVSGSGGFKESESFRGRIRGDRASGTVAVGITLDANGKPSNTGSTCRSDRVEWTARAH